MNPPDSNSDNPTKNQKFGMKISTRKIIVQALAGMGASFTIQLLHPFDLLKVRFQSHDSGPISRNIVPKYSSVVNSFKTILKQEGAGAFFKGVSISLIGNNLSYGLFFALYEKHRQMFRKHIPDSEFGLSLVSSMLAAFYGSLLMQPIWVLKTRRLLDTEKGKDWGFSLSMALGLYGTIQLTAYSTVSDYVRKTREKELKERLGDNLRNQE